MTPAPELYRAFVRDPKSGRRHAGFVDAKGKLRIPARFDGALYFREGLAAAVDPASGRYGATDARGRWILKPTYEKLFWFSEGLCRFKVGPLTGFLDRRGRVRIEPAFHDASDFHEGIAAVRTGHEGARYIRTDGTVVATSAGPNLMRTAEGLIALHDLATGKFGYVDRAGRWSIPPRFDFADNFSEGLACVTPRDRSETSPIGFIDRTGAFQHEPGPYIHASAFSAGRAVVTRMVRGKGKMGFVDRTFAEVIPARFHLVGQFANGRAPAQLARNKPWGYLDRTGAWAIAPQFADADPFVGPLAAIKTPDGRPGYVNRRGKIVWLDDPFD